MGFSKNDFEKVDLRIKKITEQTVEQIEVDSELPPTIEQLEDNNKTYSIMAAIPNAFERITEVSKLAELSGGEIIAAILVALLYLSSFISILCFMLSIIARVKNLNNASSAFFFGSIGNMTLENYKNAVKDMDEKEIVDDLEEQIHTNSKICSLKAKWYNKGIKFLLVTVILWFVCMIFQLI